MNVALFYHSLLSDWNHGNAHFLRGISSELIRRGHKVSIYEPEESWSFKNLIEEYGAEPVERFHNFYPDLSSIRYHKNRDLASELADKDLVIVHEWNEHRLVQRIGEWKQRLGFRLLFHDTHHRAVTDRESMEKYDLSNYDGVLAYGEVIRRIYLNEGWTARAWTWHEAADTNIFKPLQNEAVGDLVWVGNWGDDERTNELHEFIIGPVQELGLHARVYGVRYPDSAIRDLHQAGISYGGWLPNFLVPEIFSKYRVTVHVPRRPYVESLPGIPTIRPFEALACGIPMISSPWSDDEKLFRVGSDFLMVQNGQEMKRALMNVLHDESLASGLASKGCETIRNKHTCAHRVDELLAICDELGINYITNQQVSS